jgi:hypothetical protein
VSAVPLWRELAIVALLCPSLVIAALAMVLRAPARVMALSLLLIGATALAYVLIRLAAPRFSPEAAFGVAIGAGGGALCLLLPLLHGYAELRCATPRRHAWRAARATALPLCGAVLAAGLTHLVLISAAGAPSEIRTAMAHLVAYFALPTALAFLASPADE